MEIGVSKGCCSHIKFNSNRITYIESYRLICKLNHLKKILINQNNNNELFVLIYL